MGRHLNTSCKVGLLVKILLTPLARASTLTKAPRRLPSTRRLCLPTTPRPPTSVPPWAPTGDSAEKPRPLNMLALTLRNLNTSCKVGLLVKILLTLLARASTLTKAPRLLPSTRRPLLPTTLRPPTSVPPWAPTGDSAEKARPLNMLALTLRLPNTSPCEATRNGLILPKSNGARCSDHHLEIGVDHQ